MKDKMLSDYELDLYEKLSNSKVDHKPLLNTNKQYTYNVVDNKGTNRRRTSIEMINYMNFKLGKFVQENTITDTIKIIEYTMPELEKVRQYSLALKPSVMNKVKTKAKQLNVTTSKIISWCIEHAI